MLREGLADAHDVADLNAALAGQLDLSLLGEKLEDAILVHVFIDPPLERGMLGVLDDSEIAEAVVLSMRAYLDARAPRSPFDEDEIEPEVDDEGIESLAVVDDDDLPVPEPQLDALDAVTRETFKQLEPEAEEAPPSDEVGG